MKYQDGRYIQKGHEVEYIGSPSPKDLQLDIMVSNGKLMLGDARFTVTAEKEGHISLEGVPGVYPKSHFRLTCGAIPIDAEMHEGGDEARPGIHDEIVGYAGEDLKPGDTLYRRSDGAIMGTALNADGSVNTPIGGIVLELGTIPPLLNPSITIMSKDKCRELVEAAGVKVTITPSVIAREFLLVNREWLDQLMQPFAGDEARFKCDDVPVKSCVLDDLPCIECLVKNTGFVKEVPSDSTKFGKIVNIGDAYMIFFWSLVYMLGLGAFTIDVSYCGGLEIEYRGWIRWFKQRKARKNKS